MNKIYEYKISKRYSFAGFINSLVKLFAVIKKAGIRQPFYHRTPKGSVPQTTRSSPA